MTADPLAKYSGWIDPLARWGGLLDPVAEFEDRARDKDGNVFVAVRLPGPDGRWGWIPENMVERFRRESWIPFIRTQ
jgi:hypothetical protein